MTTTLFEQQITDCRNILRDIELLVEQNAPTPDFLSLTTLYKHKFAQLGSLQCAPVAHSESEQSTAVSKVHTTSSAIAHVSIVDDDNTCFDINYGQYSGEWIVGIDGPVESISLSMRSLGPLLDALHTLESHTKKQVDAGRNCML